MENSNNQNIPQTGTGGIQHASRITRDKNSGKRRVKLGDYIVKRGVSILGVLFIIGGLLLLFSYRLNDIFALFGQQQIASDKELPEINTIFQFEAIRHFLIFIPFIILIILSVSLKKMKEIVRITISMISFGLIYFYLYFLLINCLINIYQEVILLLLFSIFVTFVSFKLSSSLQMLMVICLNYISLFIIYVDAYYIVIFPFIIILNLVYGFIALKKKWKSIINLSSILGIFFFGFWAIRKIIMVDRLVYPEYGFWLNLLLFLSIMLLMIWYAYKYKESFDFLDYLTLFSQIIFYFVLGLLILDKFNTNQFQGLFGFGTALFYLVVYYFFKKANLPNYILIIFLIGIIILSTSLALQMKYYPILFFLVIFSISMIWMTKTYNNKIYLWFSVVSVMIIFINYIIFWVESMIPVIFSIETGLLTETMSHCSFAGLFVASSYLSSNYIIEGNRRLLINTKGFLLYGIKLRNYCRALRVVSLAIFYFSFYYYLNLILSGLPNIGLLSLQIWYSYSLIFLISMMYYIYYNNHKRLIFPFSLVAFFLCLLYPFLLYMNTVSLRDGYLHNNQSSIAYFAYHYINVILAAFLFYQAYQYFGKKYRNTSFIVLLIQTVLAILLIFIVTTEFNHIWIILTFPIYHEIDLIIKYSTTLGYTIIWALSSFVMIYVSIRMRKTYFRTLALLMIFFTSIKIFTYDFERISADTQVIIMIIYGILLVLLPLVYRRLKNRYYRKSSKHSSH